MDKDLLNSLKRMSEEYYDLHSHQVPEIPCPPTPVEFMQNWVSSNFPVIIKNAVKHWPAFKKWNNEYLRSSLEGQTFTVAVTHNGYADAVYEDKFLLPEERLLTFNDFLNHLENTTLSEIFYVQKQNDNLNDEFKSLKSDIEDHIPWATEAFGNMPDAVNFWMGDKRAVTSLHKDFYENIYCVIKGQKEFILHPPIDAPWIPYEKYKVGTVSFEKGFFHIVDSENEVHWIPLDPLVPDFEKYPLYKNAKQYRCVVEEGDMLYLPSLWFHHVRQSHGCIAVNYWYDMKFDIKYSYFKLLEECRDRINKVVLK